MKMSFKIFKKSNGIGAMFSDGYMDGRKGKGEKQQQGDVKREVDKKK